MDYDNLNNDSVGTLQDVQFLSQVPEKYIECVLIQQQQNRSKGNVFNVLIDTDNPVCFTMFWQRELIIHPAEKSGELQILVHSCNEDFPLNGNNFKMSLN